MFFYNSAATADNARLQAELMATTANVFADFATNANQHSRKDFDALCDMVTQLSIMAGELAATLEVVTGFSKSKADYYNQYDK